MGPAAWVVYNDHEEDGQSSEHIYGAYSVIHSIVFYNILKSDLSKNYNPNQLKWNPLLLMEFLN